MKKSRLSFLLAIAVILTVIGNCLFVATNAETKTIKPTYEQGWSEVIDSAVEGKDYSKKDNDYSVYTATGLCYVLSVVDENATIVLENNIDLSDRYWDSYASCFTNVTFDGNNKTISGLIFEDDCYCFLVHETYSNCTFKNIIIKSDITKSDGVALLAYAVNDGNITVENCSVTGDITFDYDCEYQYSSILFNYIECDNVNFKNITLDVNVNYYNMQYAADSRAGLISHSIKGDIINLENISIKGSVQFENKEDMTSSWDNYGCIAGQITTYDGESQINMKNCNVSSDITFNGQTSWYYFGGFVGYIDCNVGWNGPSANMNVENCSYNGNIVAECDTIEFIHFGSMFGNIYYLGDVVVTGGFVKGSINVDAKKYDNFNDAIGSFAGSINVNNFNMKSFESDMDIVIKCEIATENIKEQYRYGHLYSIGGVIGYLSGDDSFSFENCSFSGDISLINQGVYYVSGVAGSSYSCNDSGLKNTSYTGDITLDHVSDINYVAGLLAYPYQSSNTIYMLDSGYTGNIALKNDCYNVTDIAGLLGRSYTDVNMVNCYHIGDITVNDSAFEETCGYVGGLASELFHNSKINIENSYSDGDIVLRNVENIHMVGGMIAYVQGDVNITSDYDTFTDISVEKKWAGFTNLPTGIKVQLYAGDQAIDEVIELNESNGWKYTWTNLPLPLKQAKEDSNDKISYHKGDIIIENSTLYKNDGSWVGGLVGDHEGKLELSDVYHVGNITVKNCDGRNAEVHIGGWFGGCGNTNTYDQQTTDYSASTVNKNSYCIADVTVEDCYNVSTLYVGGIIGSSKKDDTKNDFENFFYQGTVTVKHEGNKYFGSLFGYLSQIGEFTNFNYDVKTISNEEKEIGFCGNIDFDESVLNHFVENDKISQIITAESYSVKEQEIDNCSVSYDRDGNNIVITNTYKSNVPATGDNFYLYITIMMVSLVGLAYVSFKKKQID